ncbi:MAG TPA: GNAT family N-acetyltransferase [Candidatus Sulfopaludibacter sp.]|jgi:hypothetical protein|nr:GNAT family N-acetyltransferase [Candidatus Sulfopaludibacter sp.]
MRLETYLHREHLSDRIRVASFGSATALRFDDVGYFNRVYSAEPDVVELLPELEEFYRHGNFGCELVGASAASRTGWKPSHRYAWMYAPDIGTLARDTSGVFDIRPVQPSEQELYLLVYLRAFEAQEDRIPSALRNMRHLFDRPELDFLLAWYDGQPAGIAQLMRCDGAALLCAGAALPEFREMGCHASLLAARIALAADAGCQRLYSWAVAGGQSHANMRKAGLQTAGITQAWRYSPEPDR